MCLSCHPKVQGSKTLFPLHMMSTTQAESTLCVTDSATKLTTHPVSWAGDWTHNSKTRKWVKDFNTVNSSGSEVVAMAGSRGWMEGGHTG